MRNGTVISGVMHLVLLLLALFGPQLFSARAPRPFHVTNVELIDGTDFQARLSTAPIVPNEGPAEMAPEAQPEAAAIDGATPDVSIDAPAMPQLTESETPVDRPPDFADLLIPQPPTVVPTEAPRPSIALIPSPDPMTRRAEVPESRPSTEPLQPLASAPAPQPAPQPAPPPEPEPVAAEEPSPEPPEPQQEPEPEAVAEAQPDAPVSAAPQEARLPVARPAEIAAADQASSAPEPTPTPPPQADTPQPSAPAGGSTSQFANLVTRGEKDALRLGIKRHFVYNGNRADRSLHVTIAIQLSPAGKIVGGPELLRASGGDEVSRNALFKAGRLALYKAQNAGEFARLPVDKFEAWELIHVTFTPDERVDFAT